MTWFVSSFSDIQSVKSLFGTKTSEYRIGRSEDETQFLKSKLYKTKLYKETFDRWKSIGRWIVFPRIFVSILSIVGIFYVLIDGNIWLFLGQTLRFALPLTLIWAVISSPIDFLVSLAIFCFCWFVLGISTGIIGFIDFLGWTSLCAGLTFLNFVFVRNSFSDYGFVLSALFSGFVIAFSTSSETMNPSFRFILMGLVVFQMRVLFQKGGIHNPLVRWMPASIALSAVCTACIVGTTIGFVCSLLFLS